MKENRKTEFFEKINKIDNPLVTLTRKIRENPNYQIMKERREHH